MIIPPVSRELSTLFCVLPQVNKFYVPLQTGERPGVTNRRTGSSGERQPSVGEYSRLDDEWEGGRTHKRKRDFRM